MAKIGVAIPTKGRGLFTKVEKSFEDTKFILIFNVDTRKGRIGNLETLEIGDEIQDLKTEEGLKQFENLLKEFEVKYIFAPSVSSKIKEIASKLGIKIRKVSEGTDVEELSGEIFEEILGESK